MHKWRGAITALSAALLALAGLPATQAAADTVSTTVSSTVDAYVSEAAPTSARGATDPTNCSVNDDPGNAYRCLVQFTVSGLPAGATVTGAQLRVVDKGNADGTKLVNASAIAKFDENTVTWANMDALGPVLASDSTHVFGQDSVWDLPASAVSGNGTFAFALWSPANSYPAGMNFQPSENTVGKPAPRLVLTYDTARFPGDPGPGKLLMGLNDPPATSAGSWQDTEAALPAPGLGAHRIYTQAQWRVPTADIQATINRGQVPVVSWGFAPYTVSTVPQSAIDSLCDGLKAFAPHPIYAVASGLHEPEDNISSSADMAAFRQIGRDTVHTCDARGVDNVTWTGPAYMNCTFSGGCAGRVWSNWYADCLSNCGTASPTFAIPANKVIDVDTEDVYVPLIGSSTWTAPSTQMSKMISVMTASGSPPGPIGVMELGVKSDSTDLTRGPAMMQDAVDFLTTHNGVLAVWWDTGGDSMRPGPTPSSDPDSADANTTGQRLDKLAQLVTSSVNFVLP